MILTGHPIATIGEHLANEAARRIVAQVGGELRILSMEESGLGSMTNRFDVVTIGPNDERAIVVWVVVRTKTGSPVVFAARFKSGAVEVLDLLASLGCEREVQWRRLLGCLEQPERRLPLRPDAKTVLAFHDDAYSEWLLSLFNMVEAQC